jgi:renalase
VSAGGREAASADDRGGEGHRVVVIGAGLAGLTTATRLSTRGYRVTVLDKGRGAGGRMSTRRDGTLRFDHGAQYFTARDRCFVEAVQRWQAQQLVARWEPRLAVIDAEGIAAKGANETARYVGVPGMNALAKHLAAALADCRLGWQVAGLRRVSGVWQVEAQDGRRLEADTLVVSTPPEQARRLLAGTPAAATVDRALAPVKMLPGWAVMVLFDRPLLAGFEAAFVNTGPLSWLCAQASKHGRDDADAWVLHACATWSAEHIEDAPSDVAETLIEQAARLPGASVGEVRTARAHRWRYALADTPLDVGALWFDDHRLAIAGDWCCGSRIEGAYLSGVAAAGQIGVS